MALFVSPALLLLSRPLGFLSVSIALVFTVACCALARTRWAGHSELTIPSIVTQPARVK